MCFLFGRGDAAAIAAANMIVGRFLFPCPITSSLDHSRRTSAYSEMGIENKLSSRRPVLVGPRCSRQYGNHSRRPRLCGRNPEVAARCHLLPGPPSYNYDCRATAAAAAAAAAACICVELSMNGQEKMQDRAKYEVNGYIQWSRHQRTQGHHDQF